MKISILFKHWHCTYFDLKMVLLYYRMLFRKFVHSQDRLAIGFLEVPEKINARTAHICCGGSEPH